MVNLTGQPYAYTGDDPVNGVDPLGLCTVAGEGQLYAGPCATTGAEAIAAEKGILAASQRTSLFRCRPSRNSLALPSRNSLVRRAINLVSVRSYLLPFG